MVILMNFEEALDELWWFSDQKEPMTLFCNFIEDFARQMKGKCQAKVVDLYDYGFEHNNIYIAYNNQCGEGTILLWGSKFIEYIKDIMSELDDEYKELWTNEIIKIIKTVY